MPMELIQALKSIEGFKALPDSVLAQLAPLASIRTLRAGETIFCQGEPSPYCFGILSGEVVIQHMSKDRRFPPKVLGVLVVGDLFGESSIFEDSPRAAMASGSREGELVAVRGQPLRAWIQSNPAAGQPLLMALLQASVARLQKTNLELAVIDGLGRLLGTREPFLEQLAVAFEFLRASLEGLTDIVLYRRAADGEVFAPFASFPALTDLPAMPGHHEIVEKVKQAGSAQMFVPGMIQPYLEAFQLPWKTHAAMAIIPLFDRKKSHDAMQGLLVLASQRHPQAFSAEKHLLLASAALPFAEAISRQVPEI